MAYTRLFSSIVHSTVWREPPHVRLVWVTMLALASKRGVVSASIPGLADVARVSLDQVLDALERLSAPDPYSRSKACEGRRIHEIDGGWELINHRHYREIQDDDQERIDAAERQRRHRAKVALVTECHASHAEGAPVTRITPPAPSPAPSPTPASCLSVLPDGVTLPPAPVPLRDPITDPGPSNGQTPEIPDDVRTERAIKASKVAGERKLLGLVGKLAKVDPKGREPVDLMRLVTAYDRPARGGEPARRMGGVVNPALLTAERVEKSIEDAEALLAKWTEGKPNGA